MSTTSSIGTNTTAIVSTNICPEQAVAFAALILADDNVTVTPEKLQALLKAAGITEVEPIWTTLFANALKDKDVKVILTTVATSSPARGDVISYGRESDDHNQGVSEPDVVDPGRDSDSDEDAMYTFGFFD